jgi:hypothetical protein
LFAFSGPLFVQVLLGQQANPNLTAKLNTTALEISAGCGHTAVEAVLERKQPCPKHACSSVIEYIHDTSGRDLLNLFDAAKKGECLDIECVSNS